MACTIRRVPPSHRLTPSRASIFIAFNTRWRVHVNCTARCGHVYRIATPGIVLQACNQETAEGGGRGVESRGALILSAPPVSDRTTQVARRTISKAGRRESWNETVVDKQAPSRLICLLSGLLSNCTLLVNKDDRSRIGC